MELTTTSPLTGVSHLLLHVTDTDASATWYMRALGLEETSRQEGRVVGLQSVDGSFRLGLKVGLATPAGPDGGGALDHVAFAVSDLGALHAWADHLTEIGIAHEGVKPNPLGFSVDLFDPDGINIELVSDA